MDGVHIEVMAYRGKNGSYAREHVSLWIVRIVGVDGTKRRIDQSTWHGCPDEAIAIREAENWSRFLNVPICRVDGGESPCKVPPGGKRLGGHAPD